MSLPLALMLCALVGTVCGAGGFVVGNHVGRRRGHERGLVAGRALASKIIKDWQRDAEARRRDLAWRHLRELDAQYRGEER